MIQDDIVIAKAKKQFPFLQHSSSEFQKNFFAVLSHKRIPKGRNIALEGSKCEHLALVMSGSIRVFKLAKSGREITLYRMNQGDSCVLTASCIINNLAFPAQAVTEEDVEILIIPASAARQWLKSHDAWAEFLFSLISKRLNEVITLLSELAFFHIDERLAAYLLALPQDRKTHTITHQKIADDLGTTREVISRIMKDFEAKGFVLGKRGLITLVNIQGLKEFTN